MVLFSAPHHHSFSFFLLQLDVGERAVQKAVFAPPPLPQEMINAILLLFYNYLY